MFILGGALTIHLVIILMLSYVPQQRKKLQAREALHLQTIANSR